MMAGCGGSSSPAPPSSPPPGSGDAIQITGRERFGWTQAAANIAPVRFAVYVDGARADLPAAVCRGSAPSFDCDSPLPGLGGGRHVLELVAWELVNGSVVESARAAPLIVQVSGSTASEPVTSPVTVSIREETPASTKGAPTRCGLAPVSSDRFLLWIGPHDVRMVDRQSLASHALALTDTPDGWNLIGLGAHSRFDDTGWIYAVQTSASGDRLRLVRYRDVRDLLGEAAVLREVPLSSAPARARVAVREQDRIYVALLAGAASDRANAGGDPFLIRLNPDGSIPAENPMGSIYMPASSSPLPLAVGWATDDEVPWFIERAGGRDYVLRRRGAAFASRRFSAAAPPAALQFANGPESSRLLVVHTDGSLTTFARTPAGWSMRDTRAGAALERTGDALLFPDGDLITCGATADAPSARYVVRRGSVPE